MKTWDTAGTGSCNPTTLIRIGGSENELSFRPAVIVTLMV